MLKCEPLSFLEIGSQWEGENHPKREAEGGLKKELKTSTRLLQSVLCEKRVSLYLSFVSSSNVCFAV